MPSARDAYEVINEVITPEVLDLFRQKQGNHTTGDHFLLLGAKGQFAELNKKFWKLYAAVWTGEVELIGEDVDEVASDMIGHLLLLIYSVRRDRYAGAEEDSPESPLPEVSDDAQVETADPRRSEMQGASGPSTVTAGRTLAFPPRCGRCPDCLSSEPIWCGAWDVPNEYALENMTTTQVKRMKSMFEALR